MIYGSWNIRSNRQIFVILGHFLPFQPTDNLENKNFKIEQKPWRYYHFTHLHHKWQSYGAWFLRYGVQQTKCFVTLDCFLPFYSPMDPEYVHHKWQSYDAWFLRYGMQQTEFFVILECFLHFNPPNNPKIQNFEKMKKILGDIIILHRYTINYNHMM